MQVLWVWLRTYDYVYYSKQSMTGLMSTCVCVALVGSFGPVLPGCFGVLAAVWLSPPPLVRPVGARVYLVVCCAVPLVAHACVRARLCVVIWGCLAVCL